MSFKHCFYLLIISFIVIACSSPVEESAPINVSSTETPSSNTHTPPNTSTIKTNPLALEISPPDIVPISDEAGAILATQEGPLWVLVSGVDEHGLIAERDVSLLDEAKVDGAIKSQVRTGTPAFVHQIEQSGPQNLRRFYQVQTTRGETGWVSDYYIRRIAFLYLKEAEDIPLFANPRSNKIEGFLPNVSPVVLKDPTQTDWWQIESVDGSISGWVYPSQVKESGEREFLLIQQYRLNEDPTINPSDGHDNNDHSH